MGKLNTTAEQRLARRSHAEPPPPGVSGDCMIWTGATTPDGYGQIRYQSVYWRTHRLAWVERHGPIPDGTPHVLHRCDRPACWADAHLYLGTPANNAADKITRGRHRNGMAERTHCPHGHEYDEANTAYRVRADGGVSRRCRRCNAIRTNRAINPRVTR